MAFAGAIDSSAALRDNAGIRTVTRFARAEYGADRGSDSPYIICMANKRRRLLVNTTTWRRRTAE
jgi:hypothetical protein